MTITLFVGDCTEGLAEHAKAFDNLAYLVDSSNYKNFLAHAQLDSTVYTSAADLPKITKTECAFFQVLQKADKIYYCPPAIWSDHQDEFSLQNIQQITEYFLYLLQREKNNVQGLDLSKYKQTEYLKLTNVRTSNNKQLWVAGCSITAGVGVADNERYPSIISKLFDGKFVDLSRPGSSIEFAADQILRSDIRPGDIVVWGLTSEYRALIWDRKFQSSASINPYTFDYINTNRADDIVDETRLYRAAIAFAQVENFCQKVGAHLIAIPVICSEALQLILHDHAGYYQLPYRAGFLDLGSDNLHPGPAQHQWYADHINNILKTWV